MAKDKKRKQLQAETKDWEQPTALFERFSLEAEDLSSLCKAEDQTSGASNRDYFEAPTIPQHNRVASDTPFRHEWSGDHRRQPGKTTRRQYRSLSWRGRPGPWSMVHCRGSMAVAAAVDFQTDRRWAAPYRPPPHSCPPGRARCARGVGQWPGANAPEPCERRDVLPGRQPHRERGDGVRYAQGAR
jgi:hypothetical protein